MEKSFIKTDKGGSAHPVSAVYTSGRNYEIYTAIPFMGNYCGK